MSAPTSTEYQITLRKLIHMRDNEIPTYANAAPDRWTGELSWRRNGAYVLGKYLECVNMTDLNAIGSDLSKETLDQIWQGWCTKGLNTQVAESISPKSPFNWRNHQQLKDTNKEYYDRIIVQDTELRQQDVQIRQLNIQLKQQETQLKQQETQLKQQETQLKQQETQLKQQIHTIKLQSRSIQHQQDTIDVQDKQLKRQADQLKEQAEWIKEYNDKSLVQSNQLESKRRDVNQLIDLVTTKEQVIDTLETQMILIRSDLVQQFYQSEQTINKLLTQMIGIQPDLLQLSDLYYEQQSKSNKLEDELQCKNSQLTVQEDNIKQLLIALETSQSKQGLASAISGYFK
jgi:chromosome segregation ATPase